ncbi:hypothetical protein [Sporomusa aerivorans]|uniref:hypothetical protein n=1 Tax=Sporomusa aerivorans TaxID=204936 RepID=UPI00352A1BF7
MDHFNEGPMQHACRPPKCIGKFNEKYKVYEVCCRVLVKICSKCGCEYEPHMHPMCPRCREHDGGGFGGFGGYGGFGSGGFGRPGFFGFSPMKKMKNEMLDDDDDDSD